MQKCSRRNYIAALCATMCRRSVFESIVGFNPRFSIAEGSTCIFACSGNFLRKPMTAKSQNTDGTVWGLARDCGEMLREALSALRAQQPRLSRDPNLICAYREEITTGKRLRPT